LRITKKTKLKKLLYLLLFIPLISFSQETKNVLNIDTIKEEYIKTTDGITYYNGKPYNGVFISNHDNGQLKFKANFKDGKRDGLYEEYYENGQLKIKTTHKNGLENGLKEWYFKNGQLGYKQYYKYGKRDGLSEEYYHDNGQFKFKSNYKYGKQDGLFERYYENGQLVKNLIYRDGKIVANLRLIFGDTNIEDVNVYDLEAMVKLFLKDCELNNIKLSSDYKITSTFETLDKGVLAKAYGIFNDEEIIIKVNPQDWSNASNPKRWYILYHELGHDVLNLQHGQGGKMMFNYSEKDYNWEGFIKDKDYMFNSMKKE
jgi:antitoxin component YwqK of YwqJK toxin-antitoxin module